MPPLLDLQQLHPNDGPPLPLDQQLNRFPELQILLPANNVLHAQRDHGQRDLLGDLRVRDDVQSCLGGLPAGGLINVPALDLHGFRVDVLLRVPHPAAADQLHDARVLREEARERVDVAGVALRNAQLPTEHRGQARDR